ncbi:MAG: nucleotidyltransferase family protein [Planctomycetes bacterium]|nr:nucleotidyltransferase family protein [Planctomycetota bacterium]
MTTPTETPRIWAIVPAAGLSRRMGRAKQSIPIGDSTITGTVVNTLLSVGVDQVVVVTRSELAAALGLPEDARLRVVINDDSRSAMIDSIRIGIDALAPAKPALHDGVLVVPGDMPALPASACTRCMAAFRDDPGRIVIATLGAARGHPIIFPYSLRSDLETLGGGLRELSRRHPQRVHSVVCDHDGVVRDIDTPGDLDRL